VELKAPDEKQDAGASPPAPKQVWQAAGGQPVNESALTQLLNALADLRCEKFIDDRQKADFTAPLFTLELKGGRDYTLAIFAKAGENDPNYPAVSSGSEYPFELSASQVERIMKEPSAFLQTAPTDQKKIEKE
jgi:hypothetical protein